MALAIGAEDKKKLYILLGLAGVLGVLVMVVINPLGIGKKKTGADSGQIVTGGTMPTEPVSAGPGGRPGGPPGPKGMAAKRSGETATAPSGDASATPVQLVGIKSFRSDPFKPFYTPTIQPPPPPPPIPPPLNLPSPRDTSLGLAPAPVPGGGGSSGALVQLPPIGIPHSRTRSSRQNIPKPAGNSEDGGDAIRSPNKRMAGVIIGDSVRALIVISNGDSTITRVVQPGDDVEGMKILRIERITENNTLVTRMTVNENGQERFFDLQPAPAVTTAPGGAPTP